MHSRFKYLLASAALLCACQGTPRNGQSDAAAVPLIGTEWRLVTLNGQAAPPGAGGKPATITFGAEDNRVAGFAGCNRVAGTYQQEHDSLRLGPLILTRMACTSGMELEQQFTAALDAARRYQIVGRRLDLLGDAGVVASLEAP